VPRSLGSLAASLLLLAAASASAGEAPGEYALQVRAVWTGTAPPSPALIHVRGGKVVALLRPDQADRLPPEVPLLDRRDLVATPGLVLATQQVASASQRPATISARYRALDAHDPFADQRRLLSAGITTVFLHPGRGRLITGEGAVVKLAGDAPVVRARGELVVEVGPRALGPPPRVEIPVPSSSDVPIEPGVRQRPTSRLGIVSELQSALRDALTYEADRRRLSGAARPELDPDKAAMAEAFLAGRLRFEAREAGDLRAAMSLARALGVEPLLAGATEAHAVLDELGQTPTRVIFEMTPRLRGSSQELGANPERLRARLDTPAKLAAAGIPFALAPAAGGERDLRLLAALSVRGGLSRVEALAAVTAQAASVLGVGGRVGRIAPGRDADIVLWSDHPLKSQATVVESYVDGRRVYRRARPSAPVDALVVRAGTIHTMLGEPIRDGEVLVQDGTIAAVGSSVPHPRGARVIDAGPDGVVTPGFIDAFGHLAYEGDKGAVGPEVAIHRTVAGASPHMTRVARGGVTTVITAPWRFSRSGSRLAALKTAPSKAAVDDLRQGMVVRPAVGAVFDLTGQDPLVPPSALKSRLNAAKAYAAKFAKHRKELQAWEQAQAKKAAQAAEARQARRIGGEKGDKKDEPKKDEPKKDEPKKDEPKKDEPKKDEPKKAVDPISGTWAFTLSGGPLPEPQRGELALKLEEDGRTIAGVARQGGRPGEVPISGELNGTTVTLTLETRTPFGPPKIQAELVGEDQMRGSVRLGPLNLTFEANRTEREVPELKLNLTRRTKKGARPEPPPVDEGLEPLRAVFEGRGALVLRVGSAAQARTVLKMLAPTKLPVVLLGFYDADLVAKELKALEAPVLLRPEAYVVRAGEETSPAADLAQRGLSLGFTSMTGEGAADLPARALVAVEAGMSRTQALRALTVDAARAYRLEGRVGTLRAGADGDLLVWDGPPLEATSRLRAVVIGGRAVEEE
jgi:imidazolonepropionase-like amidohydrolase